VRSPRGSTASPATRRTTARHELGEDRDQIKRGFGAFCDSGEHTRLVDERRRTKALVLAIVLSVLLYAASLGADFTLDDWLAVVGHPGVRGPLSWQAIFGRDFWGHPFGDPQAVGTYRPLLTLTYWLDVHIWQSPRWMHAVNLGLYGAVLLCAERLLRRLVPLTHEARLLAVLVFGTLGIHADVVPSVTGRSELLASLFTLIAMERAIVSAEDDDRSAVVAAALAAIAAMSCKESAFATTLVLPWLAFRRRTPGRAAWAALGVATLVPLAAMLWFRRSRLPLQVHGEAWQISNPLLSAPFGQRLLGAGEALVRYVEHTLAPLDACADYGYATLLPSAGPRALLGLALMASALGIATYTFRRAPHVCDTLLLGGASYFTVSHLLLPGSAFVADRLFFLPSLFLVTLAALALDRIAAVGRRKLVAAGALLFATTQACFTLMLVPNWHDDLSLSAQALGNCSTGMRMRVYRGETLHRFGKIEETAWSFLVAGAIFDRFPQPVADEEFPLEWEQLPVAERVARLRARLGPVRFARAVTQALDALANKRWSDASVIVRRWGEQR